MIVAQGFIEVICFEVFVHFPAPATGGPGRCRKMHKRFNNYQRNTSHNADQPLSQRIPPQKVIKKRTYTPTQMSTLRNTWVYPLETSEICEVSGADY